MCINFFKIECILYIYKSVIMLVPCLLIDPENLRWKGTSLKFNHFILQIRTLRLEKCNNLASKQKVTYGLSYLSLFISLVEFQYLHIHKQKYSYKNKTKFAVSVTKGIIAGAALKCILSQIPSGTTSETPPTIFRQHIPIQVSENTVFFHE